MPEYDGGMIIDTHIDIESLQKDSEKLLNTAKQTANSIAKSFSNINPQLRKVQAQLYNTGNALNYLYTNQTKLESKYPNWGFDGAAMVARKLYRQLVNLQFEKERLINVPMINPKEVNTVKNISRSYKDIGKLPNYISSSFSGIGDKIRNSFSGINNFFGRITRRARWILLGQTIRRVFAEAGQSFTDLQTYSAPVAKTAQSLTDAFKRVANSIITAVAPVLQALAPIIINIANAITGLMNKVSMFTSALFLGSKTATIANTNFSGYSKTVAKTTKNTKNGTKAVKEQYKALAKFDKLDVFKRDKKPQPSSASAAEMPRPQALDMFKQVTIPNNILDFANKLKETFAPLAEEFKIIGDSFQKNFAEPVMQHIRENFLPRFLESTKRTLHEIDFSNLNNSLERFFKTCSKFTIKTFDRLSWAWENIFLPMSKWTAEQFLPKFLDALSSAIDAVDTAIDAASPALKDFLAWAGDIGAYAIISGLDALKISLDALKDSFKALGDVLVIVQPWLKKSLDWSKDIIKDYIREGLTAFSNAFMGIKWAIESVASAISGSRTTIQGFLDVIEPIANTLKEIVRYMMPGYGLFKAFNQLSWAAKAFNALRTGDVGELSYLSQSVPALAEGTVVSPNRRFLAMLGDNTYEPEVVSPISTMKRAFSEAINESNIQGGTGNITLEIDGKTFARLINPYMDSEKNRVGISMVQGVY